VRLYTYGRDRTGVITDNNLAEDTVFADSFCTSSGASRFRRRWTTLVSFVAQALGLSIMLLLPLLYTQGLPQLQLIAALEAPSPLPPGDTARLVRHPASNVASNGHVIAPPSVPNNIAQIDEPTAPRPVDLGSIGVSGGMGNGRGTSSVLNSIGNGLNSIVPPPPPVTHHLRVSQMMEGNLIYRVQPQYPPLARQARIQGAVVLHAVIDREGKITHLEVLSGHPMLVQAALDAVRQWRYRPYYLNSEPVEVETSVTVNFTLSGG
jgi:periplasmic protein TonB